MIWRTVVIVACVFAVVTLAAAWIDLCVLLALHDARSAAHDVRSAAVSPLPHPRAAESGFL